MGITDDKVVDKICELLNASDATLGYFGEIECVRYQPFWVLETDRLNMYGKKIQYKLYLSTHNDMAFKSKTKFIEQLFNDYSKKAYDILCKEYFDEYPDMCEGCDKILEHESAYRDCCKLLCYDCCKIHDVECKDYVKPKTYIKRLGKPTIVHD